MKLISCIKIDLEMFYAVQFLGNKIIIFVTNT